MKHPSLIGAVSLAKCANENAVNINGRWVPARPLGFQSFFSRVRCTWLVFTGKADALVWPEGQ
jgi:hypothetical protein